jgi:hypothetical protein
MLSRLVREPLVHFLVLGGVLFAIFGRGGSNAGVADRQIVVSEADIDRLAEGFSRTWHRPPRRGRVGGADTRLHPRGGFVSHRARTWSGQV